MPYALLILYPLIGGIINTLSSSISTTPNSRCIPSRSPLCDLSNQQRPKNGINIMVILAIYDGCLSLHIFI